MKRYLQYLNVDSSYSLFIMVLSNVGCMEVLYNMCVCVQGRPVTSRTSQ